MSFHSLGWLTSTLSLRQLGHGGGSADQLGRSVGLQVSTGHEPVRRRRRSRGESLLRDKAWRVGGRRGEFSISSGRRSRRSPHARED